jgi:hypothetical protein
MPAPTHKLRDAGILVIIAIITLIAAGIGIRKLRHRTPSTPKIEPIINNSETPTQTPVNPVSNSTVVQAPPAEPSESPHIEPPQLNNDK